MKEEWPKILTIIRIWIKKSLSYLDLVIRNDFQQIKGWGKFLRHWFFNWRIRQLGNLKTKISSRIWWH